METTAYLQQEELDLFLRQLLNIGEGMYRCGSEISRIEQSLRKLGKAYGAEHVNVYAITSSIVITIEFPGTSAMTQSRRITRRDTMDLSRLEHFNALCRSCCEQPIPVAELREKTLSILSETPNQALTDLGTILAGAAFAVFFGGNAWDFGAAAMAAELICLVQRGLQPLCKGKLFYNIVISFLTGSFVCLMGIVFPMLHPDTIIIGDIMVLIPGVAITNSLRYTLSGDSISGVEKLVDSVLLAAGIAAGFTLSFLCFL